MISKPVYALLLTTVCLSTLTSLQPRTVAALTDAGSAHAIKPSSVASPSPSALKKASASWSGYVAAGTIQLPPPVIPRLVAAPVVPVKPVAPPLPYVYLGQLLDDGKQTVFMKRGDEPLTLIGGEVTDDGWRLEQIETRTLLFTHLATGDQRRLEIL